MDNPNLPVRQTSSVPGSPLEKVKNAIIACKCINASSEDEISAALKYIMVLLGLKIVDDAPDLPTPLEKDVIMDYLLDECSFYTPEEIKLAFKLGLAGKTGMKHEDTQLYGKRFSAAFISKFVNAYTTYKQGLYKANLNKPDPNQKRFAEPTERPEDKEKVDKIIGEIKDKLQSPTAKETPPAIRKSSQVLTQQMFHTELVNNIKELTMEELESLIKDCVKYSDVKALKIIEAEIDLRNKK